MRLDDLPAVLTVVECQEVLRLGKHSVRALIERGELRAIRAGRAIRVTRASVLELLGEASSENGSAPASEGGRHGP